MKTISIIAYKRPDYFEQLVLSLIKNDLKNWRIYIQLDPSDKTNEIIDIANKYLKHYDLDIRVNHKRLGVRLNPYSLLQRVFDNGSKLNIHLEEDIVISDDVTKLALWYEKQNLENILCMNLVTNGCFSASSVISYEPTNINKIIKTKLFNSIGIILTNLQWNSNIKEAWMERDIKLYSYEGVQVDGWDVALYGKLLNNPDLYTLSPLTPRTTHIGKFDGEYCS